MPEAHLQGRRILIVEDEFMLAESMCHALTETGATALGPAPSIERALALLDSLDVDPDAAVLDVNLRGKPVYPVADMLLERNVPFVFTTGYDAFALPPRFATVMRYEKPIDMPRLLQTLDLTFRGDAANGGGNGLSHRPSAL